MALRTLIILPEAERDTAQTYAWYESQEPGLGEAFLGCVETCIEFIRRSPQMYPIVLETYRRAVVRRFPYVIFYEQSERIVTIYAIFHCAQDPKKWRNRLP
jgi:plasmid stabilization system protein ParE